MPMGYEPETVGSERMLKLQMDNWITSLLVSREVFRQINLAKNGSAQRKVLTVPYLAVVNL